MRVHEMNTQHVTVPDSLRFEILRLLEQDPNLSQREIARAVGVSLGKINYCLRALVASGLLKIERFRTSENRSAYAYLLTPRGLDERLRALRRFLRVRSAEVDALRDELTRLEQTAGRSRSAAGAGRARFERNESSG